jgi:hypothetical protein
MRPYLLAPRFAANRLWLAAREVPSWHIVPVRTGTVTDLISGSQIITFTNSSPAWGFNSSGVLVQPTSNVPFIEYDPATGSALGWRVWDAVTNLKTNSESVSAGFTQQQSTVTSDVIAAPSGAQTADLLVPNTTTASHASFNASIAFSSSTLYTWSLFLKAGGYTTAQFAFTSAFGNSTAWANFILSGAGSVGFKGAGGTAGIQALPNGWYRCFLTATSGASATTGGPVFIALDSDRNARDPSFAGNGVDGVYAWGAQINTGPLAPYVPTTSLTASSTADVASITGAAFAGIWNQAASTVFASTAEVYGASGSTIYNVSDGTASNRLIAQYNSPTSFQFRVITGGVDQVNISQAPGISAGDNVRYVAAYSTDDFAGCINNGTLAQDVTVTLPIVDRMRIGANINGVNFINGYIREMATLKSRRPNANLQAMMQ